MMSKKIDESSEQSSEYAVCTSSQLKVFSKYDRTDSVESEQQVKF